MTTTTAGIPFQRTEANARCYQVVHETVELVSDEADALVAALIASERIRQSTGDALTLEETMRALGIDPNEYGL